MRSILLIALLAAMHSVAVANEPEGMHQIEILADVPSVPVSPRRSARFTMRLPNLTYALTMNLDCGENWKPESVSISVADSRMSFDAEKLQNSDSLEFDLQVPSRQIGPLRLEQFCIDGDQSDTAGHNMIIIQSVLSAQASLRCASDAKQSIRYVTVPLDVSLECVVPETTDD